MTPRAEIFAAFRAAVPGIFSDPARISILDGICDDFGVPRDPEPSPASGMQIGPNGIALIKKWEGCHKKRSDGMVEAYPDPGTGGAPWTIGWGSTGHGIVKGTVWTQQQCDDRLETDLIVYAQQVAAALGNAPTTQDQFDALVSFHYNTGAIARATLTKKHKAGDHEGAAEEFGKWINAGGRPLQGLRARRWDERRMYEGKA